MLSCIIFKGWFSQKKKKSSFTHPHVILNMYDLLSSAEQKEDLETCLKSLGEENQWSAMLFEEKRLFFFEEIISKKEKSHTGLKQHMGE